MLDTVRRLAPLWRRLAHQPDGQRAVMMLLRYLGEVSQVPRTEFVVALETLAAGEEDALLTVADQWRQEGRIEGRQEGRIEGRLEGLQQGERSAKRQALTRLLELRFGAVDEAQRSAVAAADVPQLDAWFERAARVPTLADVFTP